MKAFGQGIVDAQGKTYTLNEGEGILLAPCLHHTYTKTSEEWLTSFATFTGTIEICETAGRDTADLYKPVHLGLQQ